VDVDGAIVEDSELCELKVRGDLIARNVRIRGLQLYENTGSLYFEDCVIESFDVVIFANTHIYGNVQLQTDEIFDWGGWTEFSVTRHYPIVVVDREGIPQPSTTVEIVNPRGEVEARLITDQRGMVEAVIHFTEETCASTWQVRVPSLGISLPITLLSDTPFRTEESQSADHSVSLRQDTPIGSSPFLTWTPEMIISTEAGDAPEDPRCDIVALFAHEREGVLYVRVELRGGEIDTEGIEFGYNVYITSSEWGNIGFKLALDKRMMWRCLNWEAIESFPVEWRTYESSIEVAVPLELLPSFERIHIGGETRLFPDTVLDYVVGIFSR